MKRYVPKIIAFVIFYLIFEVISIMLIFGWGSFGSELTWWQKVIGFFGSFPSSFLNFQGENLAAFLIINTAFWTMVFISIIKLWSALSRN